MKATTQLGSALAEFQQRLTTELVAITIEQPGYAGFGCTTRSIIRRNLARWHLNRERFIARQRRAS